MAASNSSRIIATPSSFAKSNFLYVQEVGSLQSIEPHISKRENLDSFLFFVVTKGSGSLKYLGQLYPLHIGDCIFIDCQNEYAHESSHDDSWELSWVHFYGKQAKLLYEYYLEQEGLFLFHPLSLSAFVDTLGLLYQTCEKDTTHKEFMAHRYLTDLVSLCFEEIGQNSAFSTFEKIGQIQDYLNHHFTQKINLDQLSEQFFISKFHLAREFKKATGSTIGNYLTNKRISLAKKQLRFTTLPLDTIARDCGLSDTSYFVKVFKSAESMTPGEYRKKW